MDKTHVFQFLSTQEPSIVLDLLSAAYDEMNHDQRQTVFGKFVRSLPPAPVDGEALLDKVEVFQRESLAEVYYAPFDINSKNYRHIPDETEEWFERMGGFLQASCQLTRKFALSDSTFAAR